MRDIRQKKTMGTSSKFSLYSLVLAWSINMSSLLLTVFLLFFIVSILLALAFF